MVPPQASDILLQSGVENTSALVEELGLNTKAIYLPSSMTGDKPKALIPIETPLKLSKKILPKRLIVKYSSNPKDVGLLVITPGSEISRIVEVKPDCSAEDLETAISEVLAGTVYLADGDRLVKDNNKIVVEVINCRLESKKMWIYECLGTPIASIVASVAAQVLDKPVTVKIETASKGKYVIELEVETSRKILAVNSYYICSYKRCIEFF
jgi:hypothetical protein